jgi:hypothetical protein
MTRCLVPFIPLDLIARLISIPSQVLKNLWNAVRSNRQHLGQVTIFEQEKPAETQTLPSDVMRQFLQCFLLAYRPWNFPTNGELAILGRHNPAAIPTHPTQHRVKLHVNVSFDPPPTLGYWVEASI